MTTPYFTAGEISGELKSRLQTIRATNGAETDIGRDVMMGRRKIPADDQPPCLIVLEGEDDVKDRPGTLPMVLVSQNYIIDGFDACDPDNPNEKAHAIIRDIKKAIFKDGTTWSGKVKSVKYLGRDIGPRPDGVALVQARVMISVEYIEQLNQP